MKNSPAKEIVKRTLFRDGAIRTIRFGPLRGKVYRVSKTTGMSPWYSGPERAHQRAFVSLVHENDTVIDVGANWGMHTIFLSHRVGTTGRVIAVEPEPRVLEELEWHIRANCCENVKIRNVALGHHAGTAAFVTGESAYTGHLATKESDAGDIRVTVTTLDALIAEERAQQIRLVKIDVEGAEASVLAGGARTLAEIRPYLIVDLHTPEQDVAVAEILRNANYDIRRIDGSPIKCLDRGWPDPEGVWGTILAKPLSC